MKNIKLKVGIGWVFLLANIYIGFAIGNRSFDLFKWGEGSVAMFGFSWVSLCICAVFVIVIESPKPTNP